MAGWGNVFGTIADFFGSKAERRRNKIRALKKEQDELKQKPITDKVSKRLIAVASELSRMYEEANNS